MLYKKFLFKLFLILIPSFFLIINAFSKEEVGKIDNVIGNAEIYDGKTVLPVTKDLPVHLTDVITTKENALVKILFFDGADIIMYEKTELKIKEYKVNIDSNKKSLKSVFENIKGKIRFFVKPDKNINNDVKYKTSNAVMGVRGTGGFIIAPDISQTQLVVSTGTVQFSNPATPNIVQEVKENQWGKIEGDKPPPPPEAVTPEILASLAIELPEGFDVPTPDENIKLKAPAPSSAPTSTPDSKPAPVIIPEFGKTRDEDSEYFKIGPMVGFGVFNFFSVGVEARLFHFLGLGVNFGGASNINLKNYPKLQDRINNNNDNTPIQSTNASIQHLEGRVVIYPFLDSFFIGAALGMRYVDATINACEFISGFGLFNSCVPLRAHLKVDTTYVTPQLGWMAVWKNGFTFGTELGAQIPLTSGNETFSSEILTNDPTQYSLVTNSYAYQNFQRSIRDGVGDYLKSKVLPFWNIIKIGWLF